MNTTDDSAESELQQSKDKNNQERKLSGDGLETAEIGEQNPPEGSQNASATPGSSSPLPLLDVATVDEIFQDLPGALGILEKMSQDNVGMDSILDSFLDQQTSSDRVTPSAGDQIAGPNGDVSSQFRAPTDSDRSSQQNINNSVAHGSLSVKSGQNPGADFVAALQLAEREFLGLVKTSEAGTSSLCDVKDTGPNGAAAQMKDRAAEQEAGELRHERRRVIKTLKHVSTIFTRVGENIDSGIRALSTGLGGSGKRRHPAPEVIKIDLDDSDTDGKLKTKEEPDVQILSDTDDEDSESEVKRKAEVKPKVEKEHHVIQILSDSEEQCGAESGKTKAENSESNSDAEARVVTDATQRPDAEQIDFDGKTNQDRLDALPSGNNGSIRHILPQSSRDAPGAASPGHSADVQRILEEHGYQQQTPGAPSTSESNQSREKQPAEQGAVDQGVTLPQKTAPQKKICKTKQFQVRQMRKKLIENYKNSLKKDGLAEAGVGASGEQFTDSIAGRLRRKNRCAAGEVPGPLQVQQDQDTFFACPEEGCVAWRYNKSNMQGHINAHYNVRLKCDICDVYEHTNPEAVCIHKAVCLGFSVGRHPVPENYELGENGEKRSKSKPKQMLDLPAYGEHDFGVKTNASNTQNYRCSWNRCWAMFDSWNRADAHMNRIHFKTTPYTCAKCNTATDNIDSLLEHNEICQSQFPN